MDIRELKSAAIELMDALASRGLAEVEVQQGDVKIRVRAAQAVPASAAPTPTAAAPAAAAVPDSGDAAAPAEDGISGGTPVVSPLVGVFYSAPSPDAPPFVLVGQKVKEGDTLFIVEAMKVMNEIKSPCGGTVARILAQPGDLVEYNQTVVIIE